MIYSNEFKAIRYKIFVQDLQTVSHCDFFVDTLAVFVRFFTPF